MKNLKSSNNQIVIEQNRRESVAEQRRKMKENSSTPPVQDAGGDASAIEIAYASGQSAAKRDIETALVRWREHRRQLELDAVATNTVIAELEGILHPAPPTPVATPPASPAPVPEPGAAP